MDLLFIGGTRFVGRHTVEAALSRGHRVTLFNRGKSAATPIEGVEAIAGDREKDLGLLKGRQWDAVIDTCGYVPRVVGLSCDALLGRVGRYVFVSSISVYADTETPMQTEEAPLLELSDPATEAVDGETYGGLKALCERRVSEAYEDKALTVRPGLVVGPLDPTDRFSYWPYRFSQPGPFVAPDLSGAPVQYIDARDLGAFIVLLCERATGGTFHVCGPTPPLPFRTFIERGVSCLGGVAEPVWVDGKTLASFSAEPWSDLPLVVSLDGTSEAYVSVDNAKALRAGLSLRTLEETVIDTAAWWRAEKGTGAPKAGLSDERQAAILATLQKSSAPA